MKLTKAKRIFVTSLLLLGTISMLGGCGGNKGNSDFTKEEMDEIDALFSDDERKELEAELGGGDFDSGSRKKEVEVTYDETLTIDPFEGVEVVISGTVPYNANIYVKKPMTDYVNAVLINLPENIDNSKLVAGDTVLLTAEFNTKGTYKAHAEEELQKNLELSRTTAELELIADDNDYKRMIMSWDELTEEQKNEMLEDAKAQIEWDIPYSTNDCVISDPIGVYYATSSARNMVAIGFDVTDKENNTITVYHPFVGIIINENTGEFFYAPRTGVTVEPEITNLIEDKKIPESIDYPVLDDENFKSEYISLR